MKISKNFDQIIKQIEIQSENKKPIYDSFFKRLGQLKQAPIMDYILKKYTQFKKQKYIKLLNEIHVKDIIIKRNKNLRIGWQMPDYVTLIWVASKVLQLNRRNGSLSFEFDYEDFNLIDQIMACENGQCDNILETLRQNQYTDKWFKEQFVLLTKIFREEAKRGQINWTTVSYKLKQINQSLYSMYRCAYQCQKKAKYTKSQYRQWTQQQDDKLLKIAEATQNTRPDWNSFQKYFQGRSGVALRTRLYMLITKLKIANPYPYDLSNQQLIRRKNEGRIDLSKADLSYSIIKRSQKLPKSKDIGQLKLLINEAKRAKSKQQGERAAQKFNAFVMKKAEEKQIQKRQHDMLKQRKKEWSLLINNFQRQIMSIKIVTKDLKKQYYQRSQKEILKNLVRKSQNNLKNTRKIRNINEDFSEQDSDSESQNSQNSYQDQNDIIFYN